MRITFAAALLLALGIGAGAAGAQTRPVTVVELFTSQGCSSCPPANANLAKLKDRPGVLALSYSVTYWDRLGWKDTFGRPEFTDRQRAYVSPLGNRSPYTPQMVVNGRADVVGHDLREVDALIAKAGPVAPGIRIAPATVEIDAGTAPARAADVWLVRYDPATLPVPVGRGENAGRTLPHAHVVRELARLGTWDGGQARLPLPAGREGLRTAVLVQAPNGGPILAAASD